MIFSFRLEKVLSVRKIEEDLASKRHADARARLYRAEQLLDLLFASLESTMNKLDELKLSDELTAEALQLHSLHIAGLKNRIEEAKKELVCAENNVEETNGLLIEAHRSREALERLREKEKEAWLLREQKRQANEIEEIVLSRRKPRLEGNHGS